MLISSAHLSIHIGGILAPPTVPAFPAPRLTTRPVVLDDRYISSVGDAIPDIMILPELTWVFSL